MTLLVLANIGMVIGSLVGMYLISERNKRGFIVFLIVEASLGYIGITTKNYGLLIAAVLYLTMNIYSYVKWSRHEVH